MKLKILCIIIILLTLQTNINILSKGDTMDLEEIDNILAEQIKKDFDSVLKVAYETMKTKGYLRNDLSNPMYDEMAQFYNLFLRYANDHCTYIAQTVPNQMELTFRESYINAYAPFIADPNGAYTLIVKEIITKKKEEMITEILKTLNN